MGNLLLDSGFVRETSSTKESSFVQLTVLVYLENMKRTDLSHLPCSIARTSNILGDWWTPLVLREAFFGVRRFDDFATRLGIGRNVLTQRLNRLTEEEIKIVESELE